MSQNEGILLVNKPKGITAFQLVKKLRRISNIKKIGHAGTLDPFATGVMVMLIGKKYTKRSDSFLTKDKAYIAKVKLGEATTTFDTEGEVTFTSEKEPSLEEIENAIGSYQGTILQTPPMFSAKKVNGKKLYDLARKGIEIEREAKEITLTTKILHYAYPYLTIEVTCSKGTYIRSLADDIGKDLQTFAHLEELTRTVSGDFSLDKCIEGDLLNNEDFDYIPHLLR